VTDCPIISRRALRACFQKWPRLSLWVGSPLGIDRRND